MEEYKVSIIMSCYNAQKTVTRAINSILKQTYSNWELIVVDDASIDNSLELVKKKADKDDRIKIIQHKGNQGAGVSRRDGILAASGDYTTFLDSDDTLVEKALEILVDNAIKTEADIVSPGFRSITKKEVLNRMPKERVVSGKEVYAMDTSDTLRFLTPCLIKAHLWDKVSYSTRRFVEDTPTLVQLLFFANKRSIIPDVTYNYYQNEGSLIHSASEAKKNIYEALCAVDNYKFFKRQGTYYPISVVFASLAKCNLDTIEGFEEEKKELVNFLNNIQL